MAEKIQLAEGKVFEFKMGRGSAKATHAYDWDGWFDGGIYLLQRSEGPMNSKGTIENPTVKRDYGVPTNGMKPKLVTAARRRYKIVEVSTWDQNGNKLKDAIIIQARPMTPEERVTEDKRRIEDAAKLKAAANGTATPATPALPTTGLPDVSKTLVPTATPAPEATPVVEEPKPTTSKPSGKPMRLKQ